MASKTFAEVLASVKVSDLPRVKQVVTITSSEKPVEGFQKLADNHILSAPVWDEAANEYTGFLDVRDLVSFVVFVDDERHAEVPSELSHLIGHGARYFKLPIENLTTTYLSRRNPFRPVSANGTLLDVAKLISKPSIHRIPVVDETGKVVNIISQTDIIKFLSAHIKECSGEAKRLIGEAKNVGTSPVLSVPKSTRAIDVFRLMDSKKLSGIAVVDEDGKLVGATSASDLKLFLKSMKMEVLQKPIFEYLKDIRVASIEERSPTIAVSNSDTFAHVLTTFNATKIHRLFVADDGHNFVPERVVSISDVLSAITNSKLV